MPRAKHRKKRPTSGRRPRVKPPLSISNGSVSIRSKSFERVRNNPDFANLIRVGRIVNSLCLTHEQVIHMSEGKSPVKGIGRSLFVLGGYLYEGYLVIESMRSTYRGKDYFAGFEDLINGNNSRGRKILQKIRDNAAFHLDWRDKTTSSTLSELDNEIYDFISASERSLSETYFDIADTIDISFLIENFREGRNDAETFQEILETIVGLAFQFARAAEVFVLGILDKLDLGAPRDRTVQLFRR